MEPEIQKTDEEVVRDCNALARRFYEADGCVVPDGYKFYEARHPAEVRCWGMAVIAFEVLTLTDVEDALQSVL